MKKVAVIYTRVSSDRQVDNMSLGEQKRICEQFCLNSDLSIDSFFIDEGESAKTISRKEFQKMLEYCRVNKARIGYVVVYKVDRFARNMEDHAAVTAMLSRMGINLLSATEPINPTHTGKLMEHMLASFAEFDNSVRSERSANGMRARAAEGCWQAHAPIGYVTARDAANRPTLAFQSDEMTFKIQTLFNEFATGRYLQSEAVELAWKLDIRNHSDDLPSKNTVLNLLRSVTHAGYISNSLTDMKRVKGLHPAMISLEQYLLVQDILNGKKRGQSPEKRVNTEYPLRRFLLCSLCERPLTASGSAGRTKKYPAYHCTRCTKKVMGSTVRISKEKAHEDFLTLLDCLRPSNWVLKVFKEITLRKWDQEFRDIQSQRRKVDKEIAETEDLKNELMTKYLKSSVISDEIFASQHDRLTVRKAQLELQRDELHDNELNKEVIVDEAVAFISSAATVWSSAPLLDKQRFQKLVYEQGIYVKPDQTFGTAQLSPIYQSITEIEKYFKNMDITEKPDNPEWCPGLDSNQRP
jgi:site-specific DNA recombinase